jgi:hypothetical protein
VNLNFSRTFIGNSFNNSSAVGGTFNSRDIPLMVTLANASGGAITGCRLAGPGDTSCPPGYTLVGTPGSIEAFCISSTPEVKALGLAGFKNCNAGAAPPLNNPTSISGSPVQNAHMCTPQEWAEACINAPGFQASATAGEEWTFQLVFYNNGSSGQQSGIRMNSNINPGTCFAFSGDAGENFFSTQLPYRCCFR